VSVDNGGKEKRRKERREEISDHTEDDWSVGPDTRGGGIETEEREEEEGREREIRLHRGRLVSRSRRERE